MHHLAWIQLVRTSWCNGQNLRHYSEIRQDCAGAVPLHAHAGLLTCIRILQVTVFEISQPFFSFAWSVKSAFPRCFFRCACCLCVESQIFLSFTSILGSVCPIFPLSACVVFEFSWVGFRTIRMSAASCPARRFVTVIIQNIMFFTVQFNYQWNNHNVSVNIIMMMIMIPFGPFAWFLTQRYFSLSVSAIFHTYLLAGGCYWWRPDCERSRHSHETVSRHTQSPVSWSQRDSISTDYTW